MTSLLSLIYSIMFREMSCNVNGGGRNRGQWLQGGNKNTGKGSGKSKQLR